MNKFKTTKIIYRNEVENKEEFNQLDKFVKNLKGP